MPRVGPAALRALPLALLLVAAPAGAQFRADPGIVINGLVTVTVHATLYDLDTPYVPLTRFQLVLRGPQGDSAVLRTDDAGVASIGRRAGTYRLVSQTSVLWKGALYRWDLPVAVRPYMGVVRLEPQNAIVTRAPAPPARAARPGGSAGPAGATTRRADAAPAHRDGAGRR